VIFLAAHFSDSALPLATNLLHHLLGTPLLSAPSTDWDGAVTASSPSSSSSVFTDPVIIALACAAVLFFLSWRFGRPKGPG
jgi:hypothetical protein